MTAQVLEIQNAAGVKQPLLDLLELWKIYGTHDITIPLIGGYRFGPIDEAQQENLFRTKMSRAATLKQTPHGRRCGLDAYPVGFNPHRGFDDPSNEGMLEKFLSWVAFVDKYGPALGLRSGRHFRNFGPYGDIPHVELIDWDTRFQFPSGDPVLVLVPPVTPGATS